ncbi:hypothetical protein QCA50_014532 [Cerrena zonata]|uniref:AMP-dependent synthetase/ligase domain-containing protein n=1 Tax=Cerrena zonata TaxID=2478898 RepID=A0AAW0FKW1_9APHY
MSSRTYLTILSDSAARYPTRPVSKIPVPPTNDTTARQWKDITYAQFAKDIDFYARFWTHRLTIGGMPSGAIIGLWVGGFEYADILHIYGLTKAGYIPQLFPGRLPNSAVIFELMEMAGAKALIHTANFGPVAESPVPTYVVQTLSSNDVKDVPHLPPPTRQPGLDDIVIIYHTSGSTGRLPKLVRCSYRWLENMVAKSATITEPNDPNRQDVTVWMGSMAHSPQNFMLMGAIQHGSCTVQPTKVPYDTDELLDMIKSCNLNRINIYSPPLTTFLRISKQDQEVLRALTQLDDVLYSGLALPQEEEGLGTQKWCPSDQHLWEHGMWGFTGVGRCFRR